MNGFDQKIANWIQFAILLLTIIVLAVHGEGRLARMEQAQIDEEKARIEMKTQIDRIELRIDKIHR